MSTETKEIDPLDLIEANPIVLAKSQRDRIIARELARLPVEFHDKVLRQPLSELERRVRSAIETFRNDQIDGALTDFALTLRSAAAYELANNPALRPWSASDAIKTWASRLADLRWNGFEISTLVKMLAAVGGETILSVSLRELTTDRRVISRTDLRAFAEGLRPWDKPDQKTFDSAFTPEVVLANAERAAAIHAEQLANPVFKSGPTRLIGTPIPVEQR